MMKSASDTNNAAHARACFRARMRAQCHEIEAYRFDVRRTQGRILTPDEAALEWITRYAQAFADGRDVRTLARENLHSSQQ